MVKDVGLDPNTRLILEAVTNRLLQDGDLDSIAIVDVGCGDGRLLAKLANSGVQRLAGVGWEVMVPPSALAFQGVDLSQAGWAEMFSGRRYDWVVSTEVIEHLVNPLQFLFELRRIVANNGRLLLTFPNVHNLRSLAGYIFSGRFSGFFGPNFNEHHPVYDQHIFVPNKHLVLYFLKLAGFSVAEVAWVNGSFELTSQTTMLIAQPCSPIAWT